MCIRDRRIAHHFLDVAVENPAKVIDCGGVDGFIIAQAVDGGAGNVVLVDECVCGFLRFLQGPPERLICNHSGSPILVKSIL